MEEFEADLLWLDTWVSVLCGSGAGFLFWVAFSDVDVVELGVIDEDSGWECKCE